MKVLRAFQTVEKLGNVRVCAVKLSERLFEALWGLAVFSLASKGFCGKTRGLEKPS